MARYAEQFHTEGKCPISSMLIRFYMHSCYHASVLSTITMGPCRSVQVHSLLLINCISGKICKYFILFLLIVHSNFAQVMEAEKQKAESGALHQEKTQKFHSAESKVRIFFRHSQCYLQMLILISFLGTTFRTKV
jgi:hypothetical protein